MDAVEVSGKSVEEAVERALDELGAERDEVEIEVLSEGRSGVLGMGATEARVRVTVLDGDTPPAGNVAGGAPARAPDAGAEGEGEEGEYVEDEAEKAAQILDKLLELMGVGADVSIRDAETPGDGLGMAKAVFDIEGDDLGILIGRRGETLMSLQYVLNLMVNRQLGPNQSFTVDVEGYRRRREQQLTSLAYRMADQVKRTGRPATLEPMAPNERRIVHMALSEDPHVTTGSVGEGEARAVSILPKR